MEAYTSRLAFPDFDLEIKVIYMENTKQLPKTKSRRAGGQSWVGSERQAARGGGRGRRQCAAHVLWHPLPRPGRHRRSAGVVFLDVERQQRRVGAEALADRRGALGADVVGPEDDRLHTRSHIHIHTCTCAHAKWCREQSQTLRTEHGDAQIDITDTRCVAAHHVGESVFWVTVRALPSKFNLSDRVYGYGSGVHARESERGWLARP